MKLNEIKQRPADTPMEAYLKMLQANCYAASHRGYHGTINTCQGEPCIDWYGDLSLDFQEAFVNGKLPFQFGVIHPNGNGCDFRVDGQGLSSVENFPREIQGSLSIKHAQISKLLPLEIDVGDDAALASKKLTSLVGIEKFFSSITGGSLQMEFSYVREGGIGLILISGLDKLHEFGDNFLPHPFVIIQKYLGRPDDIFECQNELIDADYEEFSRL